ncbi:MAG: substrate-binding domain-containing protein [Peptococcaceae bacterium]|nr:substrate-binding domain-containing protein [Peptococcaceae bacterium]
MRFRTNKTLSMILAICLIAMLVFTGCTPAQDNPQNDEQNDNKDVTQKASLQLSLEEYPRMDGSTANLPMMAEIMSQVCGITLEEAEELTTCTKTSNAWSNIANGNVDILLVYEAAEDTKAYLKTVGTELEVTPVGRDALVFINNEQNPVDNLTQAQLIDIYTGKVTNWNEVGGEDLDIIPYQRVATSGSQSLFMKLLMKDVVPMDAPMELRPAEMGMLIDELVRYNNEGNALGYSVLLCKLYVSAAGLAHDCSRWCTAKR